jgi:hypothetical protein
VQGRLVDLRVTQAAPLQERARLAFQAGRHDDAIRDLELAARLATDEPSARAVSKQLDQIRRWVAAMKWRTA